MTITRSELKHIQTLQSKKGRKQLKMFTAEGVRLLEEAVRFQFWPQTVLFAESMISERARKLVEQFRRCGVRTIDTSARQMDSLADTRTPQGVLGVFVTPSLKLGELYRSRYRKLLICENVADPGNLGTLIRSALAFAFDMVVVSGTSAEPYAPKVVRASAGATFGIPIADADEEPLVEFTRQHDVAIVAAEAKEGVPVNEVAALLSHKPIALAIGSEPHGLTEQLLTHAAMRVRIEHTTQVESLNAAVAGSILMNEIYNMNSRLHHED